MKAIVLAAGLGRRVGAATADRPKCMLPLRGRAILEWQAAAFRAAGVREIVVVVGHAADAVHLAGARKIVNAAYATTNILGSLLCAVDEIDGPTLITYGDIVYAEDVVAALVAAPGDLALVVDRDWAAAYAGRTEHPVEQAELCVVEGQRIARVGKWVGPEGAHGEYIGLMKASAAGARRLAAEMRVAADSYREREDEPYSHAARFRQAYLCDLLEDMAVRGARLAPCDIHGRWREIDTAQDYARADLECDWLY